MDNASKALIIAGGMLIAIMVASLFVYLFASYGSYAENMYDRINERQITEANNEYTKYEGSDENTIYDVVTVINKAKDHNKSLNLTYRDKAYITVILKNVRPGDQISGVSYTMLQEITNDQMVKMLQVFADNGARFSCNVNDTDGLITSVAFKVDHYVTDE